MTYEWDFFTSGYPAEPALRDCHRGPMTDLEVQMSKPFSVVTFAEVHRKLVLKHVVDTTLLAVQTRECVLRTINSELGPLITIVYNDREALRTLICEKRRATDIEQNIEKEALDFISVVDQMLPYGVQQQQQELLIATLQSNSPILRVAAKCAVIVLATLIEIG